MSSPQFTLYSHAGGPNGWKVAILLEELGLTYDTIYLDFQTGEHKSEKILALNPNGRIPILVDHSNKDFVLFESGAILEYLADKYDTEKKFSATGDDVYKQRQWLYFQSSGQGPYFGQSAWFSFFHSEKLPSAIERYQKEVDRVWGVLEIVLARKPYLVGDKPTIADLSFIPWNNFAVTGKLAGEVDLQSKYPKAWKWHQSLMERETVKKIYEIRASVQKQQSH